jgi:hypothetical protein
MVRAPAPAIRIVAAEQRGFAFNPTTLKGADVSERDIKRTFERLGCRQRCGLEAPLFRLDAGYNFEGKRSDRAGRPWLARLPRRVLSPWFRSDRAIDRSQPQAEAFPQDGVAGKPAAHRRNNLGSRQAGALKVYQAVCPFLGPVDDFQCLSPSMISGAISFANNASRTEQDINLFAMKIRVDGLKPRSVDTIKFRSFFSIATCFLYSRLVCGADDL